MTHRGRADDPDDDPDEADPFDADDDGDEAETIPCPRCRAEIYEDSVRCPACGVYLTREDRRAEGKPWWVFVGVVACLYVVYRWLTWS